MGRQDEELQEHAMKVLIACEASGVVRDAFAALGHEAVSCDLRPSEVGGPHIEGDALEAIASGRWDLMVAHPPCTYLAASGLHWNTRRPGRDQQTLAALEFVRALMDAPIERIAIENPIGRIGTAIRKSDQIIQPWWFGEPESKQTCLWLKNLPLLRATNVLPLPPSGRWQNQTPSGQNKISPGPDRWRIRSRTYAGIAAAMADQWGGSAAGFSGAPGDARDASAKAAEASVAARRIQTAAAHRAAALAHSRARNAWVKAGDLETANGHYFEMTQHEAAARKQPEDWGD
jgi:hypothetical protein